MDEIYNYSGNSLPYVAVLCHSADRAMLSSVLDGLSSHGLKLCVLNETSRPNSRLLKACAVIALFSKNFSDSVELQDCLLASQKKELPLVPVRSDSSRLSETLERFLYARNAVFLNLYSDTESVIQRILSAAALQAPQVTRAQKNAYRRIQLLLGAAVLSVIVFAAIFIINLGNGASLSKAQRGALAVYGLTEKDLDKITAFVLAGDVLECTDNEYLIQNYSGESGDMYAMASLYLSDEGWKHVSDNSPVAQGTLDDISFLSLLPNLRTLILVNQNAALPDLSPLKNLETVELIGCNLEGLKCISKCRSLNSLLLYDCTGVNALQGLSNPNLETLNLYLPELHDLSPVSKCPSLQNLEIRSTGSGSNSVPVIDYSCLSDLKDLKRLLLENRSDLKNLDFLQGMEHLRLLSIAWCDNLTDIKAVSSCNELIEFNLSMDEDIRPNGDYYTAGTKHNIDLSPLSGLNELIDIYLHGVSTNLDFLRPIASHNFYRLSFTGANLDLSGLTAVNRCEILEICDYGQTDNLRYIRNIDTEYLTLGANAGGHYSLMDLPRNLKSLRISKYSGQDLGGLETQRNLAELRLFDAANLNDYSAMKGIKFSHLELVALPNLPDFSLISFSRDAVLELILNGPRPNGITNLDCLNSLGDTYAHSSNLTLHIAQPALRDISALERFHGDMLFISPGFERSAELLVDIGCFNGYQIENHGLPQIQQENHNSSGDEPYIISSFDELYTVSDFDAQRVTSLTIAGGEVISPNAREGLIVLRNNSGDLEYTILNFESNESRTMAQGGLEDLSVLLRFPNLEKLVLCTQPINSLEGIDALTNLTSLEISNCGLTDISPVYTLQNLRSLKIGENGVTNLQGIQNLNHLEELDIAHSGITDISALSGCHVSGPFRLSLPSGRIRDFSPLSSILHYSWIDISFNEYALWKGVFDNCEIEHMLARSCFTSDNEYDEFIASAANVTKCER